MKQKDRIKKNAGFEDPMIPKVCRDPLPKSKGALERLRDAIYEKLPTMDVDSRAYKLLKNRIEQINLRLDQMSDKKGLSKMEIDKKKEASLLRGNIRLYLNVLNDKIKRSLLDQSPLPGDFEKLAKQNHDALEQLSLCSGPLEIEEREKLRAFVRFFKGLPEMTNRDFDTYTFTAYKTELEVLMKVFPD